MNTLIFEGIATSGKSSVIKLLQSSLKDNLKIRIVGEEETHEPIMNIRDELHTDFYLHLISRLSAEHPDLILIDRFYLTQAFRAKTDLKPYKKIEATLKAYNPITIFLKVDPMTIADRIEKTVQHRRSEWDSYFASKSNSREEQAEYYAIQQESQLELLKQSSLPYKIFDSTDHNYEYIATKILTHLKSDKL